MTTETRETRIGRAAEHIGARELGEDRYAYRDDATWLWYVLSADEVAKLCDYLDHADPDIQRDAYAHWCADSAAHEMPRGWTPDHEAVRITWGGESVTMLWAGADADAAIRVAGVATQWETADARHRLPLAVALACSVAWPEGDWPSMPATAWRLDPSWADGSEAWEDMEYEVVAAEEAQR